MRRVATSSIACLPSSFSLTVHCRVSAQEVHHLQRLVHSNWDMDRFEFQMRHGVDQLDGVSQES